MGLQSLAAPENVMLASSCKLVVLAALLGPLSCGSGSEARLKTLSKDDVTDLPAGNAVGTAFSGTYAIESSDLVGCHCRQGPCSKWQASSSHHQLVVTETNGALQIVENGTAFNGGIDRDGRFWCGSDSSTAQCSVLNRWEGTAIAQTSLDVVSDMTVLGMVDGQYYDCDAEARFQALYVGP